ncbi:MAG TPA: VOC family protein [Candidatus Methylacidiphilales bacterium]|jgi:PhnB protein|nr:VOC family protein [Candidatus Methylacidiphilales bacterium]
MKLNTYLHFKGNCEEALKFYEKALGMKLVFLLRYSEAPAGNECAPEMGKQIMHGRLVAGDNVIMASDCPPDRYAPQAGFSMSINVDTPAEADKYFNALSEKATICMPIEETFWAQRFGMLIDKFGVSWMVNCEKKQ